MKKILGILISILISVNIISSTVFGFTGNVYKDNTAHKPLSDWVRA